MIKKLLLLLLLVTNLFTMASTLIPATTTAASPQAQTACNALNTASGSGSCNTANNGGVGNVVRTVINVLSIIVGAISVIMIIIGGFRYVISGGDSTGTASAKNTILYALIGLVIVLFAQVIVRFVFSNAQPSAQPSGQVEVEELPPGVN